jgi:hypothetical protein
LFNKSKKIINTVENIDKIFEIKDKHVSKEKIKKVKSEKKIDTKKLKKSKVSKKKTKTQRTLWVRRKKLA